MARNSNHSNCTPTDKSVMKRPLWFLEMFSDRQSKNVLIEADPESLDTLSSLGGGCVHITLSIDNTCGNGMCYENVKKKENV